ncbi:hypothetical protein N0V82_001371 [Gnomoniopsis sp. IMI 355080]|nr:hypothetical protein N0V82_001371 [Gnomoniopsis sp. IMI 355080]
MVDIEKLMAGHSPPPYREVVAYPKVHPARRMRRFLSLRLLVALLLTSSQLMYLYFWNFRSQQPEAVLSSLEGKQFEEGLAACAALTKFPTRVEAEDRQENARWNPSSGQNETIVLRNATLFDGEDFVSEPVDIVFSKGLIRSVEAAGAFAAIEGTQEMYLDGAHVTPGLVDMHSHHLVEGWPELPATEDSNEVHPDFGPLTPFINAIDSMKAYDVATKRIASGGVTSSLIIPGSANIMGGEGAVVKNAVKAGPNGEFVVEEMLLEHGLPKEGRHRYMKMACGENPKVTYGHTRMGNVWVLRKWLAKAKELVDKQDAWCEAALAANDVAAQARVLAVRGKYPEELELDSTAGMLRGRVTMQNHCYEPEDMETMLRISHEFGFRVRAFHHALEAWQVPEMLKGYGENLTIATFAEFALYKQEAYGGNLWAGKILNEHGLPVAYKSDHSAGDVSAQYLLLQAVVGHSFGLPADKALQAVTSIPAKAIDLDNRVGYVRPGYDADIVVWDGHPLAVGTTPKQVYIDGVATLDHVKVEESSANVVVKQRSNGSKQHPSVRAVLPTDERERFCASSRKAGQAFVVTGITKAFLNEFPALLAQANGESSAENLTLIVENGKVSCLGAGSSCSFAAAQLSQENIVSVSLDDGHLTRGLTAVTSALGIAEISMSPDTGDGTLNVVESSKAREAENIDHAKYAVTLGGSQVEARSFARARLGGVTRAIQAPLTQGGLVTGISTGMRTGLNSTLLNGGLFQDDVALHVVLDEESKANDGAISMAIERLRALVANGKKGDLESPWALVANGSLPLVIKAIGNHDIQQVILLKKDFPRVNTVIIGGDEAPLFAHEIAEAKIPLILTATRPAPDTWSRKDSLPGPPLSRSPADILTEAGVFFAIALVTLEGDSRIQSLALEASWVAKYAGLRESEALALISSNVEEILGLEKSKDIVIWEGNPLHFGTPVLAFQSQGGILEVSSCWPNGMDG